MGKLIVLIKLTRTQVGCSLLSLLVTSLLQLGLMATAKADFTNGGFEDTYTPGSTASEPINGWTLTGYTFNGNATNATPTSISGINLGSAASPGGITDIYDASNPSNPDDYFLFGAIPAPTLLLPGTGLQSASINFRSGHTPLTVAGTKSATPMPSGWTKIGKKATSASQQITVQASDIDPLDGKVHVRFIASPVLENPSHSVSEQPFFAIQLNNITTGRTGASPLFFQWNFASQPGTPWHDLTAGAGTNAGSNTTYQYTDWQSFDIAPGNAFIHVGDVIEIVVVASGCSLGGHDGHVYLDDMHTTIPSSLWVTATGPASTTPGSNVTYTYTYTNNGSTPVSNVQVVANLPQGTPPLVSGAPGPVTAAQNTTYVSNTAPTTGSCSGTDPVTCSIGTLQPGQTGTFTVTVAIPGTWVITDDGTHTTGPINNGNYPISGTGVTTLLGPLVQTTLVAAASVSNLTANTSGMPTTAVVGTAYTGSFTCANTSTASATGAAPTASCDITNLPAGLVVSGCTITPSSLAWTQPADIPANQTVTCDVTGTPTATGAFTATVTTDASNNSNSTGNSASTPITVSGSDMVAASSLPATAFVSVPYTGSFTCTNNSAVAATAVSCGISGLPAGVTLGSCTSSPGAVSWTNGSTLAANQAVTCTVSGTPTSAGSVTATVTTSASNQPASSNDTTTAPIAIAVPADMVAASALPASATVGIPYTGSFTCTNNSAVTAAAVSCGISGLPAGVTQGSCTSSPGAVSWTNGSTLAANQVVTCTVSGTPTSAGSVTATVTTSASNQPASSNDTAAAPIAISAAADMVAASSLPATAFVSVPYTGSFTCTNNSAVTATTVQCGISGLPAGVTLGSCTSSPGAVSWTNGSTLAANQVVTCTVSGTPTSTGSVTATVTTNASNQTNTANDTATAPINVSNSVADMEAASALPTSATAGVPYTGSFTCTNDSPVAATSVHCAISGLPAGVTLSSCTSSPGNTPWVDGGTLPAHQAVTCTVSGTPSAVANAAPTVTTSANNQANTSNDTSSTTIVTAIPSDMVAAASLPTSATVFSPYTGSFTCTNNSAIAATSVQCAVSELPTGVTVSSCSSPTHKPWVNGSSLPAHQAVTCKVSGTLSRTGKVTARVTTRSSNQTNTANDTRATTITVNTVPVPATLNGSPILNSAIVCCGRPVILNNLPGAGVTAYKVTARTGDASCTIGHSGSQTYLKMYGTHGSCTVVGTKNGITTLPLTLRTP
jgi:uncharacterized repeat protein (TIGR01451 family)